MAAGTVGYEDTRGNNRDYLGMIASQIKNRVTEASDMANEERQFAEKKAEEGGTSLDEAGIGRGYFFGKALGSRFGGDAIARTRGRFAKTPTAGIDPKGNAASRFRGGFDYNVTNKIVTDDSGSDESALSNSVVTGFRGVQTGLTQVAKALIKIDNTLSGLEKSQMNMARAIMFQGYMMAMLRSEQQRAAGRDSLRREERNIEGGGGGSIGGQSFGGAGGGRGMQNITNLGNVGGGSGGNTAGALTSFGSSQLLGKKTKTIKGIKQGITAAAKKSPKIAAKVGKYAPSLLPGAATKVTQSLPLLPPAKTIAQTATKFKPLAAAKSLGRITGKVTPNVLKFAQTVGKNSKALAKTAVSTGAGLSKTVGKALSATTGLGMVAAAPTSIKGFLKATEQAEQMADSMDFVRKMKKGRLSVNDRMLNNMGEAELLQRIDTAHKGMKAMGPKAKKINDLRMALGVIDDGAGGIIGSASIDEAPRIFSDMIKGEGLSEGVQFSKKEADRFLKGVMDPDDYADFAKTAYKSFQSAAKKSVAETAAKSADDIAEAALKTGAKTAGKTGGKALFKSIMKKIPIIAGVAGIAFGIQRALEGDLLGAGLEITSGILGATGVGGSAGLAIDGFLLGRDLGMMNKGGDVHSGIGGMIPGGGVNKDTIPTMLTTGEFIMNRNAVDQIGSDTLNFMNNNPGQFGYSSLLGGTGSDLDLEAISTNVEDMSASINALSQQIVSIGGSGDSIINNVVNNYGSGGKPGEGGGESNGGDFSDSGLDSFRMHYLGSLM
jgi:hypothetical protein